MTCFFKSSLGALAKKSGELGSLLPYRGCLLENLYRQFWILRSGYLQCSLINHKVDCPPPESLTNISSVGPSLMTPAEVCLWPQPGAWSPQGRTPARPETPGEDIALGEGWWLLWDPNPCLNTLGPDWEEKSQSRRRESLLTLPWLPGSLAQTSGHQPLTSSPWAWLLPHSYFSYLIFSYLPKRNVLVTFYLPWLLSWG